MLGPAGPPFDRGPAARHDRRAEPALYSFLDQEVVGEPAADASPAQARLAEGGRVVHRALIGLRENREPKQDPYYKVPTV